MNAERTGSIFWMIAGAITSYMSFRLDLGTFLEPGPGLFPFLAGCFVSFMAVIGLLQSILRRNDPQTGISTVLAQADWHRPLVVVLVTIGYVLCFERLGFILSAFVFMIILLKWVERMPWGKTVMISAVTLGLSYGIFVWILKVNLPKSVLGF